MNEASWISDPKNLKDLRSVTFSQALEAGLTHSGWLVSGPGKGSGREAALASHSALPGRVEASQTNATSGPLFGGSYPSAGLQLSLASRLQARMDETGCPEYAMIWKSWDMMWGPPICALRASGPRTSGSGCFGGASGWPTTATRDWKGAPPDPVKRGRMTFQLDEAEDFTRLTGPGRSGGRAGTESCGGCLPGGWVTPKKSDEKDPGKSRDVHLKHQAETAGYTTPQCHDTNPRGAGNRDNPNGGNACLAWDAKQMAGFVTPQVKDYRAGILDRWMNPVHAVSINDQAEVFRIPDMEGWKLNPGFSLWLMGYPAAWLWNAPAGTVRGNADLSTVVPLCLEPVTP